MKVRDISPYGVRMPAELKDKLQDMAKRNGRSLNSEIVRILDEYVNSPSIEDIKPLTEEEMSSPEKVQTWLADIGKKLAAIEKVVNKNFPIDEHEDNEPT